jgi:hypothetical protein
MIDADTPAHGAWVGETMIIGYQDFLRMMRSWTLGRLVENEQWAKRFTVLGVIDLTGERWEQWQQNAWECVRGYVTKPGFVLDIKYHDEHCALALEAKRTFGPIYESQKDRYVAYCCEKECGE